MGRNNDPEFLYHYYPLRLDEAHKDQDLARIVRAITLNEIYFSSSKDFNDPFDCRPVYIANRGDFLPWVEQVKHSGPYPPEIWKAIIERWNRGDVTEVQVCSQLQKTIPESIAQNNGIFCLSSDCRNVLMWSHYSSSHTGVCLKFQAKSTTEFFGEAQQVGYQEDRPIVNIFIRDFAKIVKDTFLTKELKWKYENEFRIVSAQRKPGIHKFPKSLLKGLILGNKIDPVQKDTLRKVVEVVRGVELYEANLSSENYLMDIIEINLSLKK